MLFNSLDFAVFFPLFFIGYWFVVNRNLRLQNLFIVIASYVFYGWWNWRFLILIALTSLCSWLSGIWMGTRADDGPIKGLRGHRLFVMVANVVLNLAVLGYFKYYNFFIDSFVEVFRILGVTWNPSSLRIILPVGISFYTFQALSYSIDVYRGDIKPTKDVVAFFAFVSFFPQLVAGPIERATHLLPQFYKKRRFDYSCAVDGMRQMLWGLFKKIVIADNCAEYANQIFDNSTGMSGSTLVLGALFFTFQIYGDFSGYSDIAIGTARLFGFKLMRNFAFPYFSRDIAEFWRRWHISLSTWFRDYLYIPLGGSKGSIWTKIRNTFIIFIVSGFWHGANWTFIVWGALNALYFLPLLLAKTNRNNIEIISKGKFIPPVKDFLLMLVTFGLTVFAWIFFRAENIEHAINYISQIFSPSIFSIPEFNGMGGALITVILVGIFTVVEWLGREGQYAIESLGLKWKKSFRYLLYFSIIFLIFWFGGKEQEFIYFQF